MRDTYFARKDSKLSLERISDPSPASESCAVSYFRDSCAIDRTVSEDRKQMPLLYHCTVFLQYEHRI